ncbi:hypothetical protein AK812_SmicGene8675 [Symbiodinium microadriaticum]|uniref:Uncharacterized protein n=1 Tax=Symbiodinium microadriaticum TaxID=2951 RepID=A0A1Q9EKG8_SYMMI|nr:hypothetical protein AK812_SmicGene8675 [Symbiodinium microadriaticum]
MGGDLVCSDAALLPAAVRCIGDKAAELQPARLADAILALAELGCNPEQELKKLGPLQSKAALAAWKDAAKSMQLHGEQTTEAKEPFYHASPELVDGSVV